jgi:Phenazine biosynthesis-like protein
MRARPFVQVDVFTETPYLGNPVGVVLDATGIGDEETQQVAAWANLSETMFVLPPADTAADYQVRIFTTAAELPFAGHPTLGTAHAWLAYSGEDRQELTQQCPRGSSRCTGAAPGPRWLGVCRPSLGAVRARLTTNWPAGWLACSTSSATRSSAHSGWTTAPAGSRSCCLMRPPDWPSGRGRWRCPWVSSGLTHQVRGWPTKCELSFPTTVAPWKIASRGASMLRGRSG